MALQIERMLFTVEQYEKMIGAGILGEDDNVELIRGDLVKMAPIGLRHAACVMRLTKVLERKAGEQTIVSVQNPILLPPDSEPQPDVVLLRPRADFYTERRPLPEDVLLVIEVADTTVATDRALKLPVYARAGIAQVWIVNLTEDAVEVYSDPAGEAFRQQRVARASDALTLPSQLGASLTVREVLG